MHPPPPAPSPPTSLAEIMAERQLLRFCLDPGWPLPCLAVSGLHVLVRHPKGPVCQDSDETGLSRGTQLLPDTSREDRQQRFVLGMGAQQCAGSRDDQSRQPWGPAGALRARGWEPEHRKLV